MPDAPSTQDRGFPLVDSMRALAALSIFAFHSSFHLDGFTGPAGPYLAQLNIGVWVFFVISGFLLWRPFVRARRGERGPVHLAPYALRRAARIVPAYWVALTAIAVWLGWDYVFTPDGIPTYYLFGQLYSAHTFVRGIGQAWTLDIEVTFYAALPVLAAAAARLARRREGLRHELGLCAVLFAVGLAWQVAVVRAQPDTPPGSFPLLLSLPGWFDLFALGMALAVISVHLRGRPSPAPVRLVERGPWLAWLAAAGLFYLAANPDFLGARPWVRVAGVHELKALAAAALMLPAVLTGAGRPARGDVIRRVLAWRALRWIGLVSYGVYLWHLTIIEQLAQGGLRGQVDGTGFVIVALALSLLAGAASFYLVERPALAAAHRRAL